MEKRMLDRCPRRVSDKLFMEDNSVAPSSEVGNHHHLKSGNIRRQTEVLSDLMTNDEREMFAKDTPFHTVEIIDSEEETVDETKITEPNVTETLKWFIDNSSSEGPPRALGPSVQR